MTTLLPDASGSARASAADDLSFEDRARDLSLYAARVLALLLAIGVLGWWPFDVLLFRRDGMTFDRLAAWRVAEASVSLLAYFALGRVGAIRRHYVVSLVTYGAVSAWLMGALTVGIGAPARPFLFGHYMVPICVVILIAPLPTRVLAVAVTSAASIGSCLWADPTLASSPIFGVFLAMLLASTGLAVVGGHVLTRLVRENFLQARALAQRARELQALDRMKSDFFADISHELRTPLTLIVGSFRTLSSGIAGEAARAVIESGLRSTSRLVVLVNEILELARVEHGMRPVDVAPIDLAAVTRRVIADFESGFGEDSPFRMEGAGEPLPVVASRQQLKKVLYNLVSNALKFTDPERREVRVGLRASGDDVVLTVSDNGVGIPADQLDRIFQRFVRLEPGSGRAHEGTGIGLALVKGIVTQAGGHIEVESEPGRGSTFRVTLPRGDVSGFSGESAEVDGDDPIADLVHRYAASRTTTDTSPGSVEPADLDGARPLVLLVEDNADLRAYTRRILRRRFRVVEARDGAEALERAKDRAPDLVVTDVMMPRMGGPELLRALREDDALRETPVVFLTARAGADARSESLEAGADDYVCKPFEERELLARIDNLVTKRRQARELEALNDELEARIRARTAELHALAAHLSEVLEQERARIARDIHDELGQTLSAMRLEVEHAAREHAETEGARAALGRITHLLTETIGTSRRILSELRPRVLDDFGLIAAVEWLVEQFRARHRGTCELAIDPDLDADPARSTALFRIVQECLNNVTKHAGAARVEIALAMDGDRIRLVVRDDGKGITEKPKGKGAGGMGLLGIRERAWQFGGRVEITSAPEQGTTIEVEIPVAKESRAEEVAA